MNLACPNPRFSGGLWAVERQQKNPNLIRGVDNLLWGGVGKGCLAEGRNASLNITLAF